MHKINLITKPKNNPKKQTKKPWEKPGTHTSIKFRTHLNEVIRVGGNVNGRIYVGSMRLNGKNKRVAIKRYRSMVDDWSAARYQKVIDDLREAGVRLPKMGMIKLKKGMEFGSEKLERDEWVKVSEFFGKWNKGKLESKIVGKSYFEGFSENQKRLALIEYVKVANAGYSCEMDFLEPFKNKDFIFPGDLDILARKGQCDAKYCVKSLFNIGLNIAKVPKEVLLELIEQYGSEKVKSTTLELLIENKDFY